MESRAKIVVVEDEPYIAQNLCTNLKDLGYDVPVVASCAEDAYLAVSATKPDLVLMDIELEGPADGVQAATTIYSSLGIPVVFLTSHTDIETLRRAQAADPFGYMSKPVVRVDLANSIETALYRHRKQKAMHIKEAWLEAQLKSVGQGLIAVNFDGTIWFINPYGERLLGASASDLVGKSFISAVPLRNSKTGAAVEDLVRLAFLQGRTIDIGEDYVVDRPGNRRLAGEIAITRFEGEPIGVVFTFRDGTVEPYRGDSLSNQVVRGDLDCSRREVKLNYMLKVMEPEIRAKLPTGVQLSVSLEEPLYSISGNRNLLEVLLLGLAEIAKHKLGAEGEIHLSASNLDFERCELDGSISRYVRLRVTYKCREFWPDDGPVQVETDAVLSIDFAMARLQSALQALQATAREGASPGLSFWDIDLPALAAEPILPGKDQRAAVVVVIEPDTSIRCALCERYLPGEDIECLGARDAEEALDWVRMFRADQIDVLILSETSYTPDIDLFLKESPKTSLLLIAERKETSAQLLQRCSAPTAFVDCLCSHELLREKLNWILRVRSSNQIPATPA